MPGQGEIGGGSAYADFKVWDDPAKPSGKEKTKWRYDDTAHNCPFTLTIEVKTKGGQGSLKPGKYTVQIDQGDQVKLDW